MGLRSIGRAIAHPFEQVGQGVKHFFTGPEYDKMAGNVKNEAASTGQTQFGSTGPAAIPPGSSLPQVGGSSQLGYQNAPPSGVGQPSGFSVPGWAKSLLPKNPDGSIDWMKAIEMGLIIGAGVEGYQQSRKSDDLMQQAVDMEKEKYAAMTPIREQATAALLAGKKVPDYSNLTDQTNPYRKRMPVVGSRY